VPVKKTEAHLLEQFAGALTKAMLHSNVRRVVVESVAFLFKDSFLPPAYLLGRLLFPRTVADASAMEQVFQKLRAGVGRSDSYPEGDHGPFPNGSTCRPGACKHRFHHESVTK
jgi:hypothetical protein